METTIILWDYTLANSKPQKHLPTASDLELGLPHGGKSKVNIFKSLARHSRDVSRFEPAGQATHSFLCSVKSSVT